MKLRNVFSDTVDKIGYDLEARELHVEWLTGKYSVYKDVPPEKAAIVMGSASIGSALHQHIKKDHDHEYR